MAVEIEIQQKLLKVRLLEEIFELGLCYYLTQKTHVILPRFGKVSLEVIEEGEGIVEISCEAVKIEVKTTVRDGLPLEFALEKDLVTKLGKMKEDLGLIQR